MENFPMNQRVAPTYHPAYSNDNFVAGMFRQSRPMIVMDPLPVIEFGSSKDVESEVTEHHKLTKCREQYQEAQRSLTLEKRMSSQRREQLQKIVSKNKKVVGIADRLLAKGFEISIPPRNWYCGYLRVSIFGVMDDELNNMSIACSKYGLLGMRFRSRSDKSYKKFLGYVPESAFEAYAHARNAGIHEDNIVIVAPDEALFEDVLIQKDPMMFAYLPTVDVWFRLAVWDIKKDLAKLGESA